MAFYSNALNFPNLTNKASPTSSDIILIADAAASNIPKQCTIGSLPFAPAAGGSIVNVTASTQAMAIDTTYIVNYTGGVCTLTLPTAVTSTQGAFIKIRGGEAASNPFVIAANASQQMRMVDQTTTATTGTLTAYNIYCDIDLECTSASNGLMWKVVHSMGSFAGT